MTYFKLSPLLRANVGFDAFSEICNHINASTPSYPHYNIEKHDNNRFAIIMNVAGFAEQDLNIELEGNLLKIGATLNEQDAENSKSYLHQGIFKRAFTRQFNVPDHVNITGAELTNGLLTISLERELPEAMKPRKIAINNNGFDKKDFKAA